MLKSALLVISLIFAGCAATQINEVAEPEILVTNQVGKTKVEFQPQEKLGKGDKVDELRYLDQLLRVACNSEDQALCQLSTTYADSRLTLLLDDLEAHAANEAQADLRKPASPR